MSIELKQAAQQSTPSLQAVSRYISDVLAGDASYSEKHIARTIMYLLPLEQAVLIQQAEAKQPAAPEPVKLSADVREYLQEGINNATQCEEADIDYDFANGLSTLLCATLYTHPAPGVPVPPKATPEMRAAFRRAYREGGFWSDRLDYALDQMLIAAQAQKGGAA